MLNPALAHLTCLGLVAADYVARALRIKLLTEGTGDRLGWRAAMEVNAVGDAICAVTPLRIGGEPARLGMLLRSGVRGTRALTAISVEVLAAWPVIIVCAGLLGLRYAPEWWRHALPALSAFSRDSWPWLGLVLLLTVALGGWLGRRGPTSRRPAGLFRQLWAHWRRVPVSTLAMTVPLTLVNLTARVAILPVLAATLPAPPPAGALLVGSFALLYSQLILPTPSGAGAVDLGLLAGAAGNFGSQQGGLLLWWRFYTTGIGIGLGALVAARHWGWRAIRGWSPFARAGVAADSELSS